MQSYNVIVGVVDMKLKGFSYEDIRMRHRIGSSTITLIMNRFYDVGKSVDELKSLLPRDVEELFYPPASRRRRKIPLPDWEQIHSRMLYLGKHADLSLLWIQYKEKNPDGYQLSQFYKLYGDYLESIGEASRASMPVNRIPGQCLYLDWAGDQPEVLLNHDTGEIERVHLFVATMGFSSRLYVEAFLNEKTASFVSGTVNSLADMGALPERLVPDNAKVAVTKNTKDEMILSAAFSDLEAFYDLIVIPTLPRSPKGKPTVERGVKTAEIQIIGRLKGQTFNTLSQVNSAIKKIVADINSKPFQRRSDIRGSREEAFEKYDKPKMKELIGVGFSPCDYKSFLRIPDNYHLEYDGHYYSVPYTRLGQTAILKATMSKIKICDGNNKLICTHIRSYKTFPIYITDDTHMKPQHLFSKELSEKNGAYYRRWAAAIGPDTATLIDRVLKSYRHEEQGYRSCAGMLHMCKGAPKAVVEEAAQRCIAAKACKYSYFKAMLGKSPAREQVDEASRDQSLPNHENIRGKGCYR